MSKLRCTNGKPTNYVIDPLTKDRIAYALSCVKHLTSIESSNSGIVRAAVDSYVQMLEGLLEKPKGSFEVSYLAWNLRCAHQGSKDVWESLPDFNACSDSFPKFSTLRRIYLEEAARKAMEFLKVPMHNNRWRYRPSKSHQT